MKYLSGIIYYCVVDGDENNGEGTAEELQGSQKPKKVLFYYKHQRQFLHGILFHIIKDLYQVHRQRFL